MCARRTIQTYRKIVPVVRLVGSLPLANYRDDHGLPIITVHLENLSLIRAMLFAVFLWRWRIRLASSAWNDSSLASKLLSGIHDSAPYRKHGRTQCSIMFIEERGLRPGLACHGRHHCPWRRKLSWLSQCCCLSRTCMKGWVTTMLQDISQSWLAGFAAVQPQCVSCWLE